MIIKVKSLEERQEIRIHVCEMIIRQVKSKENAQSSPGIRVYPWTTNNRSVVLRFTI